MSIQVELIRENSVVLQTYSDPLDSAQMNALKMKMEREIFPPRSRKNAYYRGFHRGQESSGNHIEQRIEYASERSPQHWHDSMCHCQWLYSRDGARLKCRIIQTIFQNCVITRSGLCGNRPIVGRQGLGCVMYFSLPSSPRPVMNSPFTKIGHNVQSASENIRIYRLFPDLTTGS